MDSVLTWLGECEGLVITDITSLMDSVLTWLGECEGPVITDITSLMDSVLPGWVNVKASLLLI